MKEPVAPSPSSEFSGTRPSSAASAASPFSISSVSPSSSSRGHSSSRARRVRVSSPSSSHHHRRESDLRELFQMVRRRRWLIGGTVAAGLVLTLLLLFSLTPRYRATVAVMVDPRQTNVVNLEQVLSGLPANAETVQSEMEILRSRDLAGRVVDTLKLLENAEFNATLKGRAPKASAAGNGPPALSPTATEALRNQAIDRFLDALNVRISGRSRVLAVSFESPSPALAATIANTLADLYVGNQLETRMVATRNASAWLNQRLKQLRAEAEAAELAVTRFRGRMSNMFPAGGESPPTQAHPGDKKSSSSALSGESADALKAQLVILGRLRDPSGAPTHWPDEELAKLYATLSSLATDQANLSSRLGARDPRTLEAAGKLKTARETFQSAVEQRIVRVQDALKALGSQAPGAGTSALAVTDPAAGVDTPGEAAARLHTLEREAEASRSLFETFLMRYKQTTEQQGLEQADARIISRASVPADPSFPDKKLFLLLAALASLGLGLALALIVEQLDSGFRSSDQIESVLRLPTIAMVPSLASLGVKDATPESYVSAKPNSAFAESVRGLRMSLLLSDVDRPPRVVMVTSALPGEGKTSVCLTLARIAAMGGERVVLVDADLRRPRVHEALRVKNKGGLVDILSGRAKVDQVLRTSVQDGSKVDFISAGLTSPHATEMVRSQAMKNLVADLAKTYSLVIIDTPPVLPVSDAKLLSLLADKVIYVVRWKDTARATVAQAVKQLRTVKARFAGVVLSQVDVRRHAEYSYSDSGYYYGRYRKYYTE